MNIERIREKQIYRWWPNGNWRRQQIVRVRRKGGGTNLTVKGPGRFSVPYNFAQPDHLHKANLLEVQTFVEFMP